MLTLTLDLFYKNFCAEYTLELGKRLTLWEKREFVLWATDRTKVVLSMEVYLSATAQTVRGTVSIAKDSILMC
jgi:hypothetical protein